MDGRVRPGDAMERRAGRRTVAGVGLVLAAAAIGFVSWDRDAEGTSAWVARHPVAAATAVTSADFELVTVRLPDTAVLFPAATQPAGSAARTIAAGEPLLAGDVGAAPGQERLAVTLSLPPERLPAGLGTGDRVDVWTRAGVGPVLGGVTVAAVTAGSELGGLAQVEVLVPEQEAAAAVGAALAEDVVVVRRP